MNIREYTYQYQDAEIHYYMVGNPLNDFLTSDLEFVMDLNKLSFLNLEKFLYNFFKRTSLSFLQGNFELRIT